MEIDQFHTIQKTWLFKEFTKHKRRNIMYANCLSELQLPKLAERVRICSSSICLDQNNPHFNQTWYCKDRLCPLCAWKYSRRDNAIIRQLLTSAHQLNPQNRFLFLTLTVKNVEQNKLKTTLQAMGRAVSKMFQRKLISKSTLGYIRTTEVTLKFELSELSFHPHMHLLLLVRPEYFSSNAHYMDQRVWQKYWQRAMGLAYAPDVDIRTVKRNPNKGKHALIASALEVAKYQVKTTDYLTHTHQQNLAIIRALRTGLKGSRHISYSGLFKSLKRSLTQEYAESYRNPDIIGTVAAIEWNDKTQNYEWVSTPHRQYMLNKN